jgi:hypothetical protein
LNLAPVLAAVSQHFLKLMTVCCFGRFAFFYENLSHCVTLAITVFKASFSLCWKAQVMDLIFGGYTAIYNGVFHLVPLAIFVEEL